MSIQASIFWDSVSAEISLMEDMGPFCDIERAKKAIAEKMGHWPNTLYLPEIAEQALIKSGKAIGYSGFDDTCIGQLNQVLGLRIIREVPNQNLKPWDVCVYLDPDPTFHALEVGEKVIQSLCVIENTISIKLTTEGLEIDKILFRKEIDVTQELFKCPYCNCYVEKDKCFFDSHREILFCNFCQKRVTQCPVCRMNMSIPKSIPEPCPDPERTVWWNPR